MGRFQPVEAGKYRISDTFGTRGGRHMGVDFAAPDGTPILAAEDGWVDHIGNAQGFGQWIVLRHASGQRTVYGHMWNAFATGLAVGSQVTGGQVIAYVGSNGQSTGAHLHFEVHPGPWRAGSQIDPLPWLSAGGSTTQEEKKVGVRGDAVWLPDVLRAKGLTVDIFPGAFDRGHGDLGDVTHVFAHHTGSFGETPRGIAQHPALGLCSQLYLARDGRLTLCGVGIAYHAGAGSYPGLPTNNANSRTIGIEAANDGGGKPGAPHHRPWSDEQYGAYVRCTSAILQHLGAPPANLVGHKDWAGKAQGKWDPGGIDMPTMRRDVQADMGGGRVTPQPLPGPVSPVPVPVEYANFGIIKRGDQGLRVINLQTRLKRNYSKLTVDGFFGPDTEAKVRDYQRLHPPLEVDGQVGPATAATMKLVA